MEALRKKRLLNIKVSGSLIYEIAFVYYFVIEFLQTSTYTDYFSKNAFHYLSLIALALILFKLFFLDKQDLSTFTFNLIALALLILTWRTSQDFLMLGMGFFIIGARNVDFRQLIKLYFIVGLIVLAFIMLSASSGLITNLVYHRDQSSIVRRSFGIVYPTDFAAHVLFLILAYVYLRFEKLRWVDYLVFILIAYLLMIFCNARLNVVSLVLTIPVVWVGRRAKKDKIISKFIASFYWTIPIIAAYCTVMLTVFFNRGNAILRKIDVLTSGRLVIGHRAYEKYGFSLLGKHVIQHGWGGASGLQMLKENPTKYFYIDSSYLRLIIMYGIVMAVIVILIMTIISWRSVHYDEFALASVMVIVAISAIVEQRLIDISYDPFLLALFASIYNIKNKENNHEKLYDKRIN